MPQATLWSQPVGWASTATCLTFCPFLNESYETILNVLMTDTEVAPLLGPFRKAFDNKAMEQMEGMMGALHVFTSLLAAKESYWIFRKATILT